MKRKEIIDGLRSWCLKNNYGFLDYENVKLSHPSVEVVKNGEIFLKVTFTGHHKAKITLKQEFDRDELFDLLRLLDGELFKHNRVMSNAANEEETGAEI